MNNKVKRAKEILRSGGTVVINEPCDCGDKIRHNNGGNYHEVIKLRLRLGAPYIQYGDTCELTTAPEWQRYDGYYWEIIEEYAGWL